MLNKIRDTKNEQIVVNYIAAKTGGAYTILEHFIDSIAKNPNSKGFSWIIFVSCKDLMKYQCDYIDIVYIKSTGWISRIYWDIWGLPKWLKKNNVKPFKVCSLQNTGIPNVNPKQFVYIHQPLILARNIQLKSFEYKMVIYRFIYFYCVKWSVSKNATIIVQTNWMKNDLMRRMGFEEENILILKPELNIKLKTDKNSQTQYSFKLFYPAVPHASYKNHELIIKSIYELKNINPDLYSKVEVLFTSTPDYNKVSEYCDAMIKKLRLEHKIKWCGYLNSEEMNTTYFNCDIILFPSKLESLGLPLIEAAYRKRNVFTLDNNFSHELLDGYQGVRFLQDNPVNWAKSIVNFYSRGFSENIIHQEFKLKGGRQKDVVQLLME